MELYSSHNIAEVQYVYVLNDQFSEVNYEGTHYSKYELDGIEYMASNGAIIILVDYFSVSGSSICKFRKASPNNTQYNFAVDGCKPRTSSK